MSVAALHEPATAAAPVAFSGQNASFRRLVVRGGFLELVTFGFYRFWLTTDIRRHLWSHTEIDGDAFEYTGRGTELLIGFLIAMAVLAPIFVAYFLAGLEIERFRAFGSLPLYLVLFVFGQFAAYRARRYRLTRTAWRGVRFWMTGSGWVYALRSVLWGLLLFPSLGLASPWRTASLERYKLRHTLYGTLNGDFTATGWQLFKRVWWVWLIGVSPFLLLLVGSIGLAVAGFKAKAPPTFGPGEVGARAALAAVALGILMLPLLPFLHAVRRAKEWAWWVGGIRFGQARVVCALRPDALIGVYWALIGFYLLAVMLFATGAGALAGILHVTAGAGGLPGVIMGGQIPVFAIAVYVVLYLALLISLGMLARIYTLQRVWRRVVASCSVIGIEAAADVAAAGDVVTAFGEGLADGLDFGL